MNIRTIAITGAMLGMFGCAAPIEAESAEDGMDVDVEAQALLEPRGTFVRYIRGIGSDKHTDYSIEGRVESVYHRDGFEEPYAEIHMILDNLHPIIEARIRATYEVKCQDPAEDLYKEKEFIVFPDSREARDHRCKFFEWARMTYTIDN